VETRAPPSPCLSLLYVSLSSKHQNLNVSLSLPSLLYIFLRRSNSKKRLSPPRAGRTLLKVVAFASRSFFNFLHYLFRPSPNLVINVSPVSAHSAWTGTLLCERPCAPHGGLFPVADRPGCRRIGPACTLSGTIRRALAQECCLCGPPFPSLRLRRTQPYCPSGSSSAAYGTD
jgi:hypothetical protein